MTIAACYVSRDGVVFGADSTSSFTASTGWRYYNNEQKLFEVGEMGSTLGVVTWGLGTLATVSYRQLFSELSDSLIHNPPHSVQEVADRWNLQFWNAYAAQLPLFQEHAAYLALRALAARTPEQEKAMGELKVALSVGFLIGGHVAADRRPLAFAMHFDPDQTAQGPAQPIQMGGWMFGGAPRMYTRITRGIDEFIENAILSSPHWTGGPAVLDSLIQPHIHHPPVVLPIREAVDWIYAMILSTIKLLKFSQDAPICGGHIEIAAITVDRRFRWVSHKGLDKALSESVPSSPYQGA
jgi:hypothetical protein